MKLAIFLGHPAHFHLFKNMANRLVREGHEVTYLIKCKDILVDLVKQTNIPYVIVRDYVRTNNSKWSQIISVLKLDWKVVKFIVKQRPNLFIGTYCPLFSFYTGVPFISCNEDDAEVVPKFAKLSYPRSKVVLTPIVCDNSKWNNKSTKYPSYHELAYLHPGNFTPSKKVVNSYGINPDKPYFIFRFASLNAHHDKGIKGINQEIATRLVEILKLHGQIYITSERPLEPEFEPYRIHINPLDMHHVMAFASLYIGDSQTMAAEAGVLGTPFVRFNDFVGRIGYLDELEEPYYDHNPSPTNAGPIPDGAHFERASYLANITHHYNLGIGIKASEEGSVDRLCQVVEQLASMDTGVRCKVYGERRQKMLADKIDYAKFLTWFIENYPQSVNQAQNKPSTDPFWTQFR